jgi:rhodanese-related sulfurtransferase
MKNFLKYCRLSFIISLLSCNVVKADTDTLELISPQEASALTAEKKAIIIDVREDNEWNTVHIPGAIHIPLAQLSTRLTELQPYKNTAIITQCRSGARSAKALDILKSAGFSHVQNMEGGLIAWHNAGLKTQ